jgi:hypothetical protein
MYNTRYSCQILVKLKFFYSFSKNTHKSNLMKIRLVGSNSFHADGRAQTWTDRRAQTWTDRRAQTRTDRHKDMTMLIVAFRNFANAFKNLGKSQGVSGTTRIPCFTADKQHANLHEANDSCVEREDAWAGIQVGQTMFCQRRQLLTAMSHYSTTLSWLHIDSTHFQFRFLPCILHTARAFVITLESLWIYFCAPVNCTRVENTGIAAWKAPLSNFIQ